MKNRQRRFPLSYQRFATIVKMFCHGFRKKNKQSDRLHTLEKVLNNATFSYIKDVQAIESKQSLLIQLADVLIGAVGYKFNGYNSSDAKLKLIERIEEHIGHTIQKTFKSARKFNVFEIDLK
ncbi:DUF3800 domain-containing protein [Geobacillus stearothermophilus]|uniref:DUF3800 domain-containing protein n=1 Tax=Geobacillus stearothermophilus TaxID=1422 RepID=UPI00066FE4CF|nr:DUF3800 domain-containing protein [Geobacillus stearothermophilus]